MYDIQLLIFPSCQTVKTKEEKEVLEHFAGMVCDVCMYYLVFYSNILCIYNFMQSNLWFYHLRTAINYVCVTLEVVKV